MDIDDKNDIVLKLLHYFITEKDYTPIVVQGLKDEIWLENMKEDYKVIRIVSKYIHNDEQLNFDIYKAKKISKSIKKQTFSFHMNILSIYTDLGENAHLVDDKNMTTLFVKEEDGYQGFDKIKKIFPDILNKLSFSEDGLSLYLKITSDIQSKSNEDAEKANQTFEKKTPYITYALLIINALIFFIGNILGVYHDMLNDYCLYGPAVRYGEYYRLFTCMFLHADIFHLLFNSYALFVIGSQVESYIGRGKYLIIYLVSGIIGSLLSITLGDYASVGASGAIFGVMGSLLYFGYHYRVYLGTVVRSQIIPLIIINLLYGFMVTGIDNFAHIGGLIGGILATSCVGVKYKESKFEQINAIIITMIFAAFLIYMGIFMER